MGYIILYYTYNDIGDNIIIFMILRLYIIILYTWAPGGGKTGIFPSWT